jgi:hypothetical protein
VFFRILLENPHYDLGMIATQMQKLVILLVCFRASVVAASELSEAICKFPGGPRRTALPLRPALLTCGRTDGCFRLLPVFLQAKAGVDQTLPG